MTFQAIKREAELAESKRRKPDALAEQMILPSSDLTAGNVLNRQRVVGNQAVMRQLVQRDDPPKTGTTTATATATTPTTPTTTATTGTPAATTPAATPAAAEPESYPEIDALDLNATAKAGAIALKKKHPEISFTSGRRDFAEQAHAMAVNIVQAGGGSKWVTDTYSKSSTRDAIVKWIDDNPKVTTVDGISDGIKATLDPMSDEDKAKISKHPAGAAFDVQPQEKDAEAIKADMKALAGATKFLEKEGGLVRWHVQF